MRRQIDPVCGKEIEEIAGAVHYLHHDKTYFFCALSCKNQFQRSPEEYLENPAGPHKNQASRSLPVNYTESCLINLNKLELSIIGMNSAGCDSRIERGLSNIQGVNDAKVNLATKKASIAYDPRQLNCFDLVRAINELGYRAKTQRVILPVQGMSCASCVNRIRATLKQVPGIIAANINFATEKAAVEYILGQVTIEDLAKAIEAACFKIPEIDKDQFVDKNKFGRKNTMSPNLWFTDLTPKKQTSNRGDQVLPLEEQINAWYSVNQKMAWGIKDVEFEKLSASLSQKLTDDDRVFGYIGVALFYGFGDDGQGNADSTLSGKLAWEYAGKHRKKNTWQCGYIDFKKPENIRLRPGAAVRPKGFYFAKIQLGQKYLGTSVSQLRQSLKMDTGWGPEGLQFLFITHFHFADLMGDRKIPFMALADYNVTPQGFNEFLNVPQIFCSNKRIGLGIGNMDHNNPKFGIPTLQI